MSGIYLVVWDEKFRDKSTVLSPTRGGWPHITLAYTGKHLSRDELANVGKDALCAWALRPITLQKAYVNSFEVKPGQMRHDVLVGIQETVEVEESRNSMLRSRYADHENFFMRDPHITYKICDTAQEAQTICDRINMELPYQVTVTGVTID